MNKTRKIFGILILTLSFAALLLADEQEFQFQEGTRLYQDGQIEEALVAFEKILDTGYTSGSVYFNIGNCYYKLGEVGKAILFYERAAKLLPGDEDVVFNLGLVNQAIVDQIEVQKDFFLIRMWRGLLYLFPKSGLLLVLGFSWIATVALLIVFILSRHASVRLLFQRLAVLMLIVTLFLGFSYLSRVQDEKNRIEAIIMADKVDVMSAPAAQGGTEVFVLHEGTKVTLDRQRDEWVEIILPDRKVGWVKREVLEVI